MCYLGNGVLFQAYLDVTATKNTDGSISYTTEWQTPAGYAPYGSVQCDAFFQTWDAKAKTYVDVAVSLPFYVNVP